MIRAAVLERELLRAARRRNTYVLRTLFAAGLLLMLGSVWVDRVEYAMSYDRRALAGIGKQLFGVYTWVQFVVLGIITPILVAQSVIEERDEKTIELLAITHLSPEGILWGKLLARIVGMASLILAGTPVLALCLSLGGVTALDVVNLLLQTGVVILSAASMATFLGLFSSGPVVPAFLTWVWLLACWGPGSLPMAGAYQRGDDGFAFFTPPFAIVEASGWLIGASLITYLPLCIGIVRVGAAAFGSMASGADDADGGYGALSTSVWKLEAVKRRTALLGAGVAFGLVGLVIAQVVARRVGIPGELLKVGWWLWNLAGVWVATVVFMLAMRWSLLRQKKGGRAKVDWRKMAREFDTEARAGAEESPPTPSEEAGAWGALLDTGPGLSPVGGPRPGVVSGLARRTNLSGRATEAATRSRPGKRWFLREVQGNPVFWRETTTRAHGALTRVLFRGYFLLIALLVMMFIFGAFDDRRSGPVGMLMVAGWCAFGAILTTVLVTSSSVAGERRAGTLALICTTKMGPQGVVFGKLQAIAAFAGPAFAIAAVMSLPGMNAFGGPFRTGEDFGSGALVVKWAALVVWGGVALSFLAISCQYIGLRAKTPGRIWLLNLLWAAFLVIGPGILLALGERNDAVELVVGVLNPLMHEPFYDRASPSPVFGVSTALWACLTLLLFRKTVSRVSEFASR